MTHHPSLPDAVSTLHDAWLRRVHQWERLIPGLPHRGAANRQAILRDIVDDLESHLLPYMRLEEQTLDDWDTSMLDLEHDAIRRAIRDLQATTTSTDPSEAQAALSRLCAVLVDHLLHERTTYLTRLSTV